MPERRNTTQRQLVLATLQANGHISAMAIHDLIRQSHPDVSLATVYRNLGILIETGQIRVVGTEDQRELYDANLTAHAHFICRSCRRIIDVEDSFDPAAITRLIQSGFAIEESRVVHYGLCAECQQEQRIPARAAEKDQICK